MFIRIHTVLTLICSHYVTIPKDILKKRPKCTNKDLLVSVSYAILKGHGQTCLHLLPEEEEGRTGITFAPFGTLPWAPPLPKHQELHSSTLCWRVESYQSSLNMTPHVYHCDLKSCSQLYRGSVSLWLPIVLHYVSTYAYLVLVLELMPQENRGDIISNLSFNLKHTVA